MICALDQPRVAPHKRDAQDCESDRGGLHAFISSKFKMSLRTWEEDQERLGQIAKMLITFGPRTKKGMVLVEEAVQIARKSARDRIFREIEASGGDVDEYFAEKIVEVLSNPSPDPDFRKTMSPSDLGACLSMDESVVMKWAKVQLMALLQQREQFLSNCFVVKS